MHSLRSGHWFKLICGASYHHGTAIRSLALAYTLAGADCIDVAAEPAAIAAAVEGIETAQTLTNLAAVRKYRNYPLGGKPWLMVSLNDGEDPHFRKAAFDSTQCPPDCPRPCLQICPAEAISFSEVELSGVIDKRCYGCGRCLPVCPEQLIYTRSYVSTPATIIPLIEELNIDAIEIHTQVGHGENFQRLWRTIKPQINNLKLLAISCPDGPDLIDYLQSLYRVIAPLSCALIWQTDGRPMSGDLGGGTTRAAIKLAQKVLAAKLPGYVQLAGGTNNTTVEKLKAIELLPQQTTNTSTTLSAGNKQPTLRLRSVQATNNQHFDYAQCRRQTTDNKQPITNNQHFDYAQCRQQTTNNKQQVSGIAYGSYARNLLVPILNQLETVHLETNGDLISSTPMKLENHPDLLREAVELASHLIAPLKSSSN